MLGEPEKYRSSAAALVAVRGRSGFISIFGLHGGTDPQGHIDIVFPDGHYGDPACGNGCYWSSNEIGL
jgi:hypothetical protein